MTRLNVPAWLRPVAGLLANTYGTPVAVHGEHIAFDFIESEPVVFEDSLSSEAVAILLAYLPGGLLVQEGSNRADRRIRPEFRDTAEKGFRLDGQIDITRPPLELAQEVVMPLLERAGELFDVPANRFIPQLMTYGPGAQKTWHLDRNPEIEPASWSRTVALSVLLGQPGEDFTGGELETPAGIVDLSRGDAAAFTSMTPHRVRPILSGTRSALVVFGSWDGWNP